MEQSEQYGPVPGQPSPIPPDFPVVWENPDDEQLFWMHDAMHFPDPLTMLDDDVLIRTLERHGFTRAAEFYEMPIRPTRAASTLTTIVLWSRLQRRRKR
jgi:hypothetical protein